MAVVSQKRKKSSLVPGGIFILIHLSPGLRVSHAFSALEKKRGNMRKMLETRKYWVYLEYMRKLDSLTQSLCVREVGCGCDHV